MQDKESMNVLFLGGSIGIKAQGTFTNKNNELIKYGPKVDLSAIVDEKGVVNPGVFLNMLDAVQKDPTAIKALKECASWKPN